MRFRWVWMFGLVLDRMTWFDFGVSIMIVGYMKLFCVLVLGWANSDNIMFDFRFSSFAIAPINF